MHRCLAAWPLVMLLAACGSDRPRGGTLTHPDASGVDAAVNGDATTNGDAMVMPGEDAAVNVPDAAMETDSGIVDTCTRGQAECTDGFAYQVCQAEMGGQPATYGPRIPCADGNECMSGVCGGHCVSPEIVLLVDRSSSMQGARWTMVKGAIDQFVSDNQTRARFGVRTFPEGGGCSVSGVIAPDVNNASMVTAALTDPNTDSQTPMSAALENLLPPFGDPNEAQYVILITDGDETCGGSPPEDGAAALARGGVDTFVIGVSTQANGALLNRIAAAGRTGSARIVNDRAALDGALSEYFMRMNVCEEMSMSLVGTACMMNTDCGPTGMCLTTTTVPISITWPDGYCTQACSPPQTPCPGGSTCLTIPGFGMSFCAANCMDPTDCRTNYNCTALMGQSFCSPI